MTGAVKDALAPSGVAAERQPLTPAAISGLLAHAGAAGLATRITQ